MIEQKENTVIQLLKSLAVLPNADENIQLLLNMTAESRSTLSKVQEQRVDEQAEIDKENKGYIKFTKKELAVMPKELQKSFIYDNKIVKYRYYQGIFQARYRRDGFCIEVAAKTYEGMKEKFIAKINIAVQGASVTMIDQKQNVGADVLFSVYGQEWLKIKAQTTKPSTYKEYERSFRVNLEPAFGHLKLSKITRAMVQEYLFKFVEEKKFRTAEKLKLQLTCIFDMAVEDYGITSPMKKIVLPYYETKKGSALTKDEERLLVEYCQKRNDILGSALLVLLYFGLRQSELTSLRIIDNKFLECETSKGRLGREANFRRIPFTPVVKRFLPWIDFEAAKGANLYSLKNAFKRLFPDHHPHELRYTFITRCKESGVNPEVVMLWDGHAFDKDVKSTEVDRGYTDYSEEYLLAEAEKVDYQF